ncbi:MAG: multiprotein bridging factor aMBF1 [Thermoplasmata archaeon]
MICELCGRNVTFCKKVTIEGVQLEVCAECSKFGIEAKKEPKKEEAPRPIVAQRLEIREKRSRPKDIYAAVEKEELVDDYGRRIRDARSRKGMSLKDLGMKINERVTVLSKVETGDMRPEDKLVAKLEKELGITLREKVAEVLPQKSTGPKTLTLA